MGHMIRSFLKLIGTVLFISTAVCLAYRVITGRMPDVKKHPLVEDFDI